MKQKTNILIWTAIIAVLTSCGFSITGKPVEGYITAIDSNMVTINSLQFKVKSTDSLTVGQWKSFKPCVKRKKLNSKIIRKTR